MKSKDWCTVYQGLNQSEDKGFSDYLRFLAKRKEVNNTSFTWNPGTGLSCWYAELADQLPAGDSLTTITPVTGYIDCEACNVQFQDPRWRLVLCDECPENIGNGAPGEIITSIGKFSLL